MNTLRPLPGTRPTVLIHGANGRFGAAAALAFAAAGWRVLAQVRRAPSGGLARVAEPVALPLTDTAGLARAAAGASVVVHAVNPPYTRWDAEAMPANSSAPVSVWPSKFQQANAACAGCCATRTKACARSGR